MPKGKRTRPRAKPVPQPTLIEEPQDRALEAQELAEQAMSLPNRGEARKLAKQALALDPECVDALTLLAWQGSKEPAERVKRLGEIVEIAQRRIGPFAFEAWRGQFWEVPETQPYMRARFYLASAFLAQDRHDEAIAQLQDMLALSPDDEMGMRYNLVGPLLAERRLEDTRSLLAAYAEDVDSTFAWARVMERYLAGDEDEARRALAEARACNRFVDERLSQPAQPHELGGECAEGSADEAILVTLYLKRALAAHPDFAAWVAAQVAEQPARKAAQPAELPDPTRTVPVAMRPRYQEITAITDAFCREALNEEYLAMCRELAAALCRKRNVTISGKIAGWAAAIVAGIGHVNFLSDRSTEPSMSQEEIAKGIGVSVATLSNRLRDLRTMVRLERFEPKWTLPSLMPRNFRVWHCMVNGYFMDLRYAPREIQEQALAQGLIPYIPDEQGYPLED